MLTRVTTDDRMERRWFHIPKIVGPAVHTATEIEAFIKGEPKLRNKILRDALAENRIDLVMQCLQNARERGLTGNDIFVNHSTLADRQTHLQPSSPTAGGETLLQLAVLHGQYSVAKHLLEHFDADVNAATTIDGMPPLAVAVATNNAALVELLISHAADVNVDLELNGDVTRPSHMAIAKDDPKILQLLIEGRADVNARDSAQWTPLHYAVSPNMTADRVTQLVDGQATLDARDADGETPLQLALKISNESAALQLLALGADPNIRDDMRTTPAHTCARNDLPNALSALRVRGADLNARDDNGYTPLHMAAAYGHPRIAKALLQYQVKTDFRTLEGETALHLAVKSNNEAMVSVLIEFHANINALDKLGYTPLDYATKVNNPVVVEKLMRKSVNQSIDDAIGQKPGGRVNQLEREADAPLFGRVNCLHTTREFDNKPEGRRPLKVLNTLRR